MAFWNRQAPPRGRAIRASAYKAKLDDRKAAAAQRLRRQEWQEEAWEYFDDLGIIKYPTWWLGNAISKLRLYAAVKPIDDPEGAPIPVTDPGSGIPTSVALRAQAEIERIKGPTGGQSEILRMLNMNLEIAGQAWLICFGPRSDMVDDPQNPGQKMEVVTLEAWDVRSIREVEEKDDGQFIIHERPGDTGRTLDPSKGDEAVTIYQRNPGWSKHADSHMRGVLVDCQALVLLQNEILAESKSRQSNGLFTVPNQLSSGPLVDTEGEDGEEAENDPLMDAIAGALIDPIEDPSSAAAVVPTFIRGEAEFLKPDVLRHITFHRDTTTVLEDRIKGRKESIAEGLNLPVEVTRGHMNTTFANAIQVDEDAYDDHLQPRVMLITDGWTTTLLQPHLIEAGVAPEIAERIIVAGDPIDLIKRVDPAESADQGVALDVISDEAWRRVKGWSEDDAPPPLDRLIRAILKGNNWDPGLVDAVVGELDPALDIPEPQTNGQAFGASVQTAALLKVLDAARTHNAPLLASRAQRALTRKNPGRALAAIDRDLRTKVLAAANHAMTRALERAGNRLKVRPQVRDTLRTINPIYAAQHLGPALVASAGFDSDTDLIADDAFDGTVAQYEAWCAHAQERALAVAAGVVALSGSAKEHLRQKQAAARAESARWLKAALLALAAVRLYGPDEMPDRGEFDPTMKVPAGLAREALAIAGGATALEQKTDDEFVVESNGEPVGEIGNGELIRSVMTDGGATIQALEWVYGPAYRLHPFEPHEELDGLIFQSFGDEVLQTDGVNDWVGINGTSYWPGDHEGCACEWAIVWVAPDEISRDTFDEVE